MATTLLQRIALSLVCLLTLCLLLPIKAQAQAYDGDADFKIYAGYMNVGGKSGAELGYDQGLSDYFSYGAQLNMLFIGKEADRDAPKFMDCADMSFHLNFHWAEPLKLPQSMDIYSGVVAGLQIVGLQTGLRYNFSETFGLYCEAQYNPLRTFHSSTDHASLYTRRLGLSAGLTFSF